MDLGPFVGTLAGSFVGAFFGYQFTRHEHERLAARARGEQWLGTLFSVVVKWLSDAMTKRSADEMHLVLREAPSVIRKHAQFTELDAQDEAALAKIADAMPELIAAVANASAPDGKIAEWERAVLVVEGHFSVLRRSLRERTRARAWPLWPSR